MRKSRDPSVPHPGMVFDGEHWRTPEGMDVRRARQRTPEAQQRGRDSWNRDSRRRLLREIARNNRKNQRDEEVLRARTQA